MNNTLILSALPLWGFVTLFFFLLLFCFEEQQQQHHQNTKQRVHVWKSKRKMKKKWDDSCSHLIDAGATLNHQTRHVYINRRTTNRQTMQRWVWRWNWRETKKKMRAREIVAKRKKRKNKSIHTQYSHEHKVKAACTKYTRIHAHMKNTLRAFSRII